MRSIITPDDLKSTELAEPTWHPAEVIDYNEKEADTDGSTNCIFTFKVIDGVSKGVVANKLLNEKGLKYNANLWKTFGFPFDKEKGYDLDSELFKKTIGFKMMIYIKRGKSNRGNEFNDIVDYKPMS